VIKSFAKEHEKLVTVAVALGGALYSPKDIDRVAALPTLEQARAKLLGTLVAPVAQLVRLLAEPGARLARTLKARSEQAA
jgi:large subunit ribosomal protein L10